MANDEIPKGAGDYEARHTTASLGAAFLEPSTIRPDNLVRLVPVFSACRAGQPPNQPALGDDLGDIYLTGLLHDIGKIGIRDDVLRKPGKLTPEEQDHIQQHVTIGYSILAELRQIRNLLPGVLYHHERYDGRGYPDGLAGDGIPWPARCLAVAVGFVEYDAGKRS